KSQIIALGFNRKAEAALGLMCIHRGHLPAEFIDAGGQCPSRFNDQCRRIRRSGSYLYRNGLVIVSSKRDIPCARLKILVIFETDYLGRRGEFFSSAWHRMMQHGMGIGRGRSEKER